MGLEMLLSDLIKIEDGFCQCSQNQSHRRLCQDPDYHDNHDDHDNEHDDHDDDDDPSHHG